MIPLPAEGLCGVAAIGAHCDDIVVGAGAPLMRIAEHNPDVSSSPGVHGRRHRARDRRENAFASLCPSIDVRLMSPISPPAGYQNGGDGPGNCWPTFAAAANPKS